ncbi:MAG: hypothetical protein Kow00117_15580 [Phototrophicales bacterium]|nr:MAG: hypothetical protein CUN56_09320 [Phototrophicales bacterium]RMG72884.1 MAG: hypothetical protein D6711_12145 [Chloroflexota bacterium]
MYVQLITIHAAPHAIPQLRRLVQTQFLPKIKQETGFIAAQLMAHIDHQDTAQLIIYWESQAACERALQSGTLSGPNFNLPAVAGLKTQHQTYVVASASQH